MTIVLACLAGIALGLRFNVAVLLPLTIAVAAFYVVASVGQSPGTIALAIVIAAVSIQAGYIIGLTGRDLFAQVLARLNIVESERV